MTFQKNDADKLRMDLIVPQFLEGLAAVLTHGAKVYPTADNWKLCDEPFRRYYAALQRHLVAYAKGQRQDIDSGYSHLYHAACCLMFLSYFEEQKQDRLNAMAEAVERRIAESAIEEAEPDDLDSKQGPQMMPYRPLPHASF